MLIRYLPLLAAAILLAACEKPGDNASASTKNTAPSVGLATAASVKEPATDSTSSTVEEDPALKRLIGQPGPALTLQTLTGETIDLTRNDGKKPVYLKMWATYCIPCRAQMPKFEQIYQSTGERIRVVAVNAGFGDDAAKVAAFAKQTGIHMPIAIDDGSLTAWLKMQGTPVHLVLGRDGKVIFAGQGDGADLDAALQQALDSPAPSSGTVIKTSPIQQLAVLKTGDVVPQIDVILGNGSVTRLGGKATGKPHALLFTATWCEDYLREMEPQTSARCAQRRQDFDRLAKNDAVQWQGIATHLWTTAQGLADYQQKTGQEQLSWVVDRDGTAFRVFGIQHFPAVALVDGQGRLQRIVNPEDTDLNQAIEQLVNSL